MVVENLNVVVVLTLVTLSVTEALMLSPDAFSFRSLLLPYFVVLQHFVFEDSDAFASVIFSAYVDILSVSIVHQTLTGTYTTLTCMCDNFSCMIFPWHTPPNFDKCRLNNL